MVRTTVTEQSFAWRGSTIVLPAFAVDIPEVRCEEAAHAALVAYFASDRRSLDAAHRLARRCIQQTFQRAYVDGLVRAVRRRAFEYASSWPQLAQPAADGKLRLRGFASERIAQMYVPFQNTGRAGLVFARRMLADMAAAAGGTEGGTGSA